MLVVANGWALAIWKGWVAREWILRQAKLEGWDSIRGPRPFTVGVLPLAFFFDAIPVTSALYAATGVTPGQQLIDFLFAAPLLAPVVLWMVLGALERPRWLLPPWYRVWKDARDERGHDANHEIELICVPASAELKEPYVYALCECNWLSDVVAATPDEDYTAAVRRVVVEARTHSNNLKREIKFPFERPLAAPTTLPD